MIQNEQQTKMMILYSLWSAGCPMPTVTLSQILGEFGIGAIGTTGEIYDLAEKKHITVIDDDDVEYIVLQKTGQEIATTLGRDLSPSVREKLMLTTAREVAKLRKDLGVAASYEGKESGGYEVYVSLSDEGSALMDLKMFAPTRAQADIMIANFKDDPYKVYREVLASMTKSRR
ncbi:MAG: DUF4364 family protein [Clostridia bacterium]|nr:DUF4364 family protein [Clostridia bacterium]